MVQPGLPTSAQLRLTAAPARGDAPLDVTFEPYANLAKPVLRSVLAFGDGKVEERSGPPPDTVPHTYAKDGVYTATLTVYLEPPFTLTAIRNVAQTRVKVGRKADEPLRLVARPRVGRAPFSVSFRATVTVAGTSWDFIPGDGTSRSGQRQAAALPRAHLHDAGDLPRRARRPPAAERAAALVRRRSRALATAWRPGASPYNRRVPWDVLTDEQREIRELVRTLARERVAPRAAEIDESHEFPWDIVELFREHEIFGLLFDEEHGGSGHRDAAGAGRDRGGLEGLRDERPPARRPGARLARPQARRLAGAEGCATCRGSRAASGCRAYALTEAGSGSDSAAMRTTAVRDGDEYVLNGSKRFITNAGVANLYTVFAKTDPDGGHAGISAFLVESDAPGFAVARLEPKMGISGSTTGELTFDDCRIPAANLLGEEGEGFKIAMRILDRSRPGVAAQALGIAQGATDYALEYAKTRETMGKPIAQHQLIQAKLADMETETEAARGLLYRFGQMCDAGIDGSELTKASAQAKLKCGDVAMWVATEAVQILGGYGYIKEYPVERFMRDAKITQIYEGTQEVQRLVIAREMLRESRAFLLAGVG